MLIEQIMAELNLNRNRKAVPKVDLTAMVDLAFLLITFFMLTTSLSRPIAMDIVKPDKPEIDVQDPWPASRTMTILLGKNNKIVWYIGETGKATPTIEGFDQIRKSIIANNKTVLQANYGDERKSLLIIVKPTSGSSYKNFVDIMDELHLAGLKTAPAIDDDHILDEERNFLKAHRIF